MRLVRQTKLFYQKGTSDKVYEIDLCEAGDGEFIVNFRYGRRGSLLREGTKTPFPESRPKAEDLFSKLVAEKTTKGYRPEVDLGTPATIPPVIDTPKDHDPRISATIARIQKGPGDAPWKLSRALFRAGQWRLTDALPHLLPLTNKATGMDAWCLAFALGRCGDHSALPALETLIQNNAADQAFVRIAQEAKVALLPDDLKARFFEALAASLPSSFSETSDVEELATLIGKNLEIPNLAADLYLLALARPELREALYSVAKTISPAGPGMLLLRQLFKAAEFRLDAEIYGILARRFDTTFGNGSSGYHYYQRKKIKRTFSTQTKKYFQRRVIRTLSQAGDDGDAATFIPLATGILLAYDDDLDHPRPSSTWGYRHDPQTGRAPYTEIFQPPRHTSHSFLYLLRDNSPDLKFTRAMRWHFLGAATPATSREEPFPHLWDAAPNALTHLLAHARAAEVQDFALRVWNDNPNWAKATEVPAIIEILSSWYAPTAELGFNLARDRWDPSQPDNELLLGMLGSSSAAAQALGGQWLTAIAPHLTSQPDLIARLAFVTPTISRDAIRAFFTGHSLLSSVQREVTPRLISALLTLSDDDVDIDRAGFAIEILLQITPDELPKLPHQHLAELATHPLERLQLLAASILLKQNRASSLPEPLLLAPLSSRFSSVRQLGLELLGTLSSSELARRAETLAACTLSKHPDLREHVRPLIEKIAPSNPSFCRDLVEQLYPLILRAESIEGIHSDLFQLLTGPLAKSLDVIPRDTYPRMLESKYAHAQALGFTILKREDELHRIALPTLIQWATHPHAELRSYIWDHFESRPMILTEHLGDCLPLLETNWTETRERAFTFFRESVRESEWSPEDLVAICDSNKTEAQSFGREMITRRFEEKDGPLYLAQLSQHPGTDLQIFASNYLMRFAADQPDRITLLEPYFRTVLSKIGAGRTAKQRIFALLEQESLKDQNTAQLVTTLLERISATIAIEDKATCINILLKIAARWPALTSPLQPVAPELRQPHAV
ncbi:WGR domain-containing protein [Verrucomicrobiaceae bacterium 227]